MAGESWDSFAARIERTAAASESVGRAALAELAAAHAKGLRAAGEIGASCCWTATDEGQGGWALVTAPAPRIATDAHVAPDDEARAADLLSWAIACHRAAGHDVDRPLRSGRGGTGQSALRSRLTRALPEHPSGWAPAFARAVATALKGRCSNAAPLHGVLLLEGGEAEPWRWDDWDTWHDLEQPAERHAKRRRPWGAMFRRGAMLVSGAALVALVVNTALNWASSWRPPTCEQSSDCGADACVAGICTPMGFVYVPPSALRVGSPTNEPGRQRRHERQFSASISRGYYLQAAEVTQGEWERLTGSRPSFFASCGQDCPVDSVNWYEAVAFANARSRAEGLTECYSAVGCRGELGGGCGGAQGELDHGCNGDYRCDRVYFAGLDCNGYRLPTEVEWENGARAGTMTPTWWGALEVDEAGQVLPSSFEERARVAGTLLARSDSAEQWPCALAESATCGPAPVATLPPNPWGLHDMLGNVSEWTHDAAVRYPEESVVDRVIDREEITRRSVRGGTWYHAPEMARAAQRLRPQSTTRWYDVGFRLARTAIQSSDL